MAREVGISPGLPSLRRSLKGLGWNASWATWLDTYLPDLLLSAYRAARRDPYQVEMRFLDMLQNPEQYVATVTDSAEFQPRNFCDVVRLCDVVDLSCCGDDADSDAETPPKRRRRG
jgi:hypothetical protein